MKSQHQPNKPLLITAKSQHNCLLTAVLKIRT